ncbi:hypothetical protein ACP4OV_015744 [Aristida adscensionis]
MHGTMAALLLLLLLLSTLNLLGSAGAATDTLTSGQTLQWNHTLVSKGGGFELGLFSPGNSNRHYLGIWFKNISKQTVVWVANREHPILDPAAACLTLSAAGELLLLAAPSAATPLWSSNASSPSPRAAAAATLQDDGNLVVRSGSVDDATAAAPVVTWQSFEHPTDTWLPGARLGYDRARGVHSFLTSWKDAEDPAPGAFSMVIDQGGRTKLDLLAGGERRYWTTGLWDGEIFANLPEMRSGVFVGDPYAPNAGVNFFSYHDRVPMGVRNFMLDVNGQMHRRQWSSPAAEWILFCSEPHDPCDAYGSCGPFGVCSNNTSPACQCPTGFAPRSPEQWARGNSAAGCERQGSPDCPNDRFLRLPYAVQLPNGSAEAAAGAGNDDKACELACLRDCSCTAYVHDGARCLVWNGELVGLRRVSDDQAAGGGNVLAAAAGAALHLRVAASAAPAPAGARSGWKKLTVLHGGGAAAVVLLLAASPAIVVATLRRRRGKGGVTQAQGSLLVFDRRAVKAATRGFSEKLGSGSFGSVFKGALPDATPVAVKRLAVGGGGARQGEKQFRAEVVTLGMIHHVNLVRLRGFCCEGSTRALVYDYMAGGSLGSRLFAKDGGAGEALSWRRRFGVAVGVARGLAYLHERCRERIIHCDVKPENILLDGELGAKLADFGMAKLVGHDRSRVLTTMRGTLGYLAPEWLAGAPVTAKADVYSFGLVLFELVSGRRNNAAPRSSPEREQEGGEYFYFPVHAAVRLHAGDVASLLDERLAGDANVAELERLCKVACWCIQDEEGDRPAMGLVVQQLEGVVDVGLPPIPPRLHMLAMMNGYGCVGGAGGSSGTTVSSSSTRSSCTS